MGLNSPTAALATVAAPQSSHAEITGSPPGAPDEAGIVEIGYRVDPAWRRRGYAKRSVEILLAAAQSHTDVQTIRASVSPDNSPSIALVTAFGFTPVGEQWDEEDGLETIYELPT